MAEEETIGKNRTEKEKETEKERKTQKKPIFKIVALTLAILPPVWIYVSYLISQNVDDMMILWQSIGILMIAWITLGIMISFKLKRRKTKNK